MTKAEKTARAANQRAYKKRMMERGLQPVTVWLRPEYIEEVKNLEKISKQERSDVEMQG